jgi:hypothetical protein
MRNVGCFPLHKTNIFDRLRVTAHAGHFCFVEQIFAIIKRPYHDGG